MVALTSGEDGLESIDILARDCRSIIEDGGLLAIEHGAEQKDLVADLLDLDIAPHDLVL